MSISQNLIKPVSVGAVGSILTKMKFPDSKVNFMGQVVPFYLVAGAAIGASFALSEVFHSYVFNTVIANDKWSEPLSAIASGGIAGAANVAAFSVYNPKIVSDAGLTTLFLLGAGSEVLGSYLSERIISPMLMG